MSLEQEMRGRIARYADRREDWNVFGLETKIEPKFARSQRRYIGASGSVDHAESNAVQPVAFTMSIQTMPGGNRIPVHCHETEETFFILEGECTRERVFERRDVLGEARQMGPHLAPCRGLSRHSNNSDKPCAIQTLLSKPRPERPRYQDQRLLDLQAATHTA